MSHRQDLEALRTLIDFHAAHLHIAQNMYWARATYAAGSEENSWIYLFYWIEAKDARDEAYAKLNPFYFHAINMKEGVRDAR